MLHVPLPRHHCIRRDYRVTGTGLCSSRPGAEASVGAVLPSALLRKLTVVSGRLSLVSVPWEVPCGPPQLQLWSPHVSAASRMPVAPAPAKTSLLSLELALCLHIGDFVTLPRFGRFFSFLCFVCWFYTFPSQLLKCYHSSEALAWTSDQSHAGPPLTWYGFSPLWVFNLFSGLSAALTWGPPEGRAGGTTQSPHRPRHRENPIALSKSLPKEREHEKRNLLTSRY